MYILKLVLMVFMTLFSSIDVLLSRAQAEPYNRLQESFSLN